MKDLLRGKLRSAITLGLVLWCAGAGCMIVSVAHGAAMTGTEGAKANSGFGQVSGSAGAHDCCKARHAAERHQASSQTDRALPFQSLNNIEGLAELPDSSDAMSCCPLTSGTMVLNGRQRISNEELSVSRGTDVAALTGYVASTPVATNHSRLPRQNQTYLRGCVFLI